MTNNKGSPNITKWYSIKEIVDIKTGEIITQNQYETGGYYTVKKTKLITINHEEHYGTIKWTHESRESGQTRLFD